MGARICGRRRRTESPLLGRPPGDRRPAVPRTLPTLVFRSLRSFGNRTFFRATTPALSEMARASWIGSKVMTVAKSRNNRAVNRLGKVARGNFHGWAAGDSWALVFFPAAGVLAIPPRISAAEGGKGKEASPRRKRIRRLTTVVKRDPSPSKLDGTIHQREMFSPEIRRRFTDAARIFARTSR